MSQSKGTRKYSEPKAGVSRLQAWLAPVRTRLGLLLGGCAILFIGSLNLFQSIEDLKTRKLYETIREDQGRYVGRIIELEGAKLEAFVQDYSAWDDMVAYVADPNPAWVKRNIDPSRKNFGLDVIAILDLEGRRLHQTGAKVNFKIPTAVISTLRVQKRMHFHARIDGTVYEVRGASIHPSADAARKTSPRGYLFAARALNQVALAHLTKTTGCSLYVVPNLPHRESEENSSRVITYFPLKGVDGSPAWYLRAEGEKALLRSTKTTSLRTVQFAMAFIVGVMVLLSLAISAWVTSPLRHLTDTLSHSDPHRLLGLEKTRGEFGELARLIIAFFDQKSGLVKQIEEREKTERKLEGALESAQAASRAKSDFLANMSHEIRTPMNGILGMTELLLQHNLDSSAREHATTVRNSAESLMSILNDILDFSKMEAGKLSLESLEFDLYQVLGDVCDLFGKTAEDKGIELVCSIQSTVPRRCAGDPVRLRQVLMNLLGNAMKFTSSGEVVVKATIDDRNMISFSVRDTGIGIPPNRLNEIFETFHQADTSTTRRFGGTGLGLAICRKLVRLMGGDIAVKSVLGRASEFSFTIDLPAAVNAEPPPQMLVGKTILVIDDNESAMEATAQAMASMGSIPAGVTNQNEILRAARAMKPDFILIDARVGTFSAVDIANKLNQEPELAKVPRMLMCTPNFRLALPAEHLALFNAVCLKPTRLSGLLVAFEKMICPIVEEAFTPEPEEEAPMSVKRILLAEDNLTNQKVAAGILSRLGCHVVIANDGVEAVQSARFQDFDLILMDIQMPNMGGLDAAKEIRKTVPKRTPIVALTANAMPGDREACMEAGMDDYLTKPVRPAMLKEAIERWCSTPKAA